MTRDQNCVQCGRCCERWGWNQKGDIEDIERWITQDRQDILQYVSLRFTNGKRRNGRDVSADDLPHVTRIHYWAEQNGRTLRHCPFFWKASDRKVYCKIHDAKPKICASFTPWNEDEGVRDYGLNCPACRETAP